MGWSPVYALPPIQQDISCANVFKMVEFCLSLSGTNAATESVFSLMNDVWTSEKNEHRHCKKTF